MATILFGWEIGGGLGHLAPHRPLIEQLLDRGHTVWFAARNLAAVASVFGTLPIFYLQVPVLPDPAQPHFPQAASFGQLLINYGFADPDHLRGNLLAWRNILDSVRPDLVIADHSPTLLLSLWGRQCRKLILGAPFCCPPASNPFPAWQSDTSVQPSEFKTQEAAMLAAFQPLLREQTDVPLEYPGQLYGQADEVMIASIAELDCYPQRPADHYWGAFAASWGAAPQWPTATGPRVFAYLKPQSCEAALKALGELEVTTVAYIPGANPEQLARLAAPTLQLSPEPLDLTQVAVEADLIISNATHGLTVQMLLAGKPQLALPINREQLLTGQALAASGAGLCALPSREHEILGKIASALNLKTYGQKAQQMAAKYAHVQPAVQLEKLVARCEALCAGEVT